MRTNAIRILKEPLSRHKLGLAVAVFAAVVAQACGIALPLVARQAIHATTRNGAAQGVTPSSTAGNILLYAGLALFGLAIVRGIARWTQSYLGEKISHQALAAIRLRMYDHLQLLSMGFFDRRPIGKIIIRFIGDANALRSWMARTLIAVPADVLTVCLVLSAIITIRPLLAVATLVPLVALPLIMLVVNPIARRLTRVTRKNQTRLCGFLNDILPNIRQVKAYGLLSEVSQQVEDPIREVAYAGIRRGRADAFIQAGAMGLATVSTATVVLTGLWLLNQNAITPGDLLIVVWISLHIRGPVNRLSRANVIHQRAMVAVDRIAALLNRKPERGWSNELAEYPGPGRVVELRRVDYEDVSKNQLLKSYSRRFEGPGLHWLGAEGPTVIDILLRIRRPHRGRVLLDGLDARTLRVSDIRSSLGLIVCPEWMSGRPFDLLALTLKHEACPEEVARAWEETAELAPEASLLEVVERCADSAPAQATVGGITPELRARISFTLGLIHDPLILLIDDPFTGCPPEVVARMTAWINRAAEERLVLVASRDHTIVKSFSDAGRASPTTNGRGHIGVQDLGARTCHPDEANPFTQSYGTDSEVPHPRSN